MKRHHRSGRRARVVPPAAPSPEVPDRAGILYVVATPIGNLDDLSARALDTLRCCRLVACEDTRVTRALLTRFGIAVPLLSCHRFNESERTGRLIATLGAGGDVALVSDGGTPGVSDPGAVAVRAARAAGFRVVPIPGPSAVTTLIAASALPPGPFSFLGFLPSRRGERRRALRALRREPRPFLLFEAPHRILDLLDDAREVLGDRECFLGREMTKMHEEFLEGTLGTVRALLAGRPIRGEFALLVRPDAEARPAGGSEDVDARLREAAREVRRLTAAGADPGRALRRTARARGLSRRELYRAVHHRAPDAPTGAGTRDEEE